MSLSMNTVYYTAAHDKLEKVFVTVNNSKDFSNLLYSILCLCPPMKKITEKESNLDVVIKHLNTRKPKVRGRGKL